MLLYPRLGNLCSFPFPFFLSSLGHTLSICYNSRWGSKRQPAEASLIPWVFVFLGGFVMASVLESRSLYQEGLVFDFPTFFSPCRAVGFVENSSTKCQRAVGLLSGMDPQRRDSL